MSKYRFLDTECSLNREEIIYEYNRLIEDIWHLEHTVSELQKDYDLMTEAYEDVSNELYGLSQPGNVCTTGIPIY